MPVSMWALESKPSEHTYARLGDWFSLVQAVSAYHFSPVLLQQVTVVALPGIEVSGS